MINFLPIQKTTDVQAAFKKKTAFDFAANQSVVELSIAEISNALPIYMCAFLQTRQDDFRFVAILGLFVNENLFISHNGAWSTPYVPDLYKYYPFAIKTAVANNTDEQAKILCIDKNGPLYVPSCQDLQNEIPLFNDLGELNELLKPVVERLGHISAMNALTQKAVALLVKHGLLRPFGIDFKPDGETREPIAGLHRIDEIKLKELSADALKELHENNALALAYAQIFSLPRIHLLKQLYENKYKEGQRNKHTSYSFDKIFGESNLDTISFNFDND